MSILANLAVMLMLLVAMRSNLGEQNVYRASRQSDAYYSDGAHSDSMPEVSAVLLQCPKEHKLSSDIHRCNKHLKEPCEPHLMVKIHINPSFHINKIEKFLILDEVYDPRKRCKAKIMSPYLIEISRGEPIMMYPLQFSKMLKFTQNSKLGDDDKCKNEKNDENDKSKENDNNMNAMDDKLLDEIANPIWPNLDNCCGNLDIVEGSTPRIIEYDSDNTMEGTTISSISASNLAVAPQSNSLNRVMQDVHEVLIPVTKVSEKQPVDVQKAKVMYNGVPQEYEIKRLQNKLYVIPKPIQKNPYANNDKTIEASIPYPLTWNQHILVIPEEDEEDINEKNKPVIHWQSHGQHDDSKSGTVDNAEDLFDDLSANMGIGKPFAEILQSNKLAQLGIIARNSPKTKKSGASDRNKSLHAAIHTRHSQKTNKKKDIQAHGVGNTAKQNYAVHKENEEFSEGNRNRRLLKKRTQSNDKDKRKFQRNFLPIFKDTNAKLLANSRAQSENDINKNERLTSYEANLLRDKFEDNEYVSKRDNEFAGEIPDESFNQRLNNYFRNKDEDTLDPTMTASFVNDDFQDAELHPMKSRRGNIDFAGLKHHENSDDDEDYDERHSSPRQANFIPGSYINFNNINNMKYASNANASDNSISDDDAFYYYLNGDYQLQMQKQIENWPQKFSFTNDSNSIFDVDKKPKIMDNVMDDFGNPKTFPFATSSIELNTLNTSSNAMPIQPLLVPLTEVTEKPKIDNFLHNSEFQPYLMMPERPQIRAHKYPRNMYRKFNTKKMKKSKGRDDDFQYSSLLADENLNTDDKINILHTMHNVDDENFRKMTTSFDNAIEGGRYVTPYPLPDQNGIDLQILNRNNKRKRKRSFPFYDNMEMPEHETQDAADVYENLLSPMNLDSRSVIDDGIQPCTTCGGKGKKLPPKSEQYDKFVDKTTNCQCRNQRIPRHQEKQVQCDCAEGGQKSPTLSDVWYSVYNMSAPLPFLTTRMRIFRKRHGTWWRIVPSITLNSLSGIFANGNLSILFSSHVDIFQLEKSLQFQDHQLLIPYNQQHNTPHKHMKENYSLPQTAPIKPNKYTILAINPKLLNSHSSIENTVNKLRKRHNLCPNTIQSNEMTTTVNHLSENNQGKPPIHNGKDAGMDAIQKIADFGSFPSTMNLLEHCPDDPKRLCLNILDDRVPAFNIKMKIPFRENAALAENAYKVKIAQIFTDATTKDALQIFIELINEGFEAKEFSISIHNCPTSCFAGSKTTVNKFLFPRIGETVTFLLPLIIEANNKLKLKKFNCEVMVSASVKTEENNAGINDVVGNLKAKLNSSSEGGSSNSKINIDKRFIARNKHNQTIVSVRELTIETDNRCACIWKCKCHCFPKLESSSNFNICQQMDYKLQLNAGLLLNSYPGDIDGEESDFSNVVPVVEETETLGTTTESPSEEVSYMEYDYESMFWYALSLLIIMLYLGLIKAILGLCITCIDKCGYDYISLTRPYKRSSRCRKFFINIFFFIVFPFLFWCKCFTPTEEDLLIASTEWKFAEDPPRQKRTGSQLSMQSSHKSHTFNTYTNPNIRQPNERDLLRNRISDIRSVGGYEIPSLQGISDLDLVLNDDIFDDDNGEDDDSSTKNILRALLESRESLKRLHFGGNDEYNRNYVKESSRDHKIADEWIKKLRSAQIVYRIFDHPIGDLRHIPPGYKYCIQGYFLPCIGQGYEFVNYNPLAQHRCLSVDGHTIQTIKPPILLCPKDFDRHYTNKYDVLHADDLSVVPPPDAPCINVSALANVASAVANIASDRSSNRSSRRRDHISQRQYDVKNVGMENNLLDDRSIASDVSDNSFLQQEITALEDEFLLQDDGNDDDDEDDNDENDDCNDYRNVYSYRSPTIPTIPE